MEIRPDLSGTTSVIKHPMVNLKKNKNVKKIISQTKFTFILFLLMVFKTSHTHLIFKSTIKFMRLILGSKNLILNLKLGCMKNWKCIKNV